MKMGLLIPPPKGEGGERSEPGGVSLNVKYTPPDCSLTLAATLPASGEG
jgi:hypothetical protein